jgi:endonuclease/exonuclease/phosphatase family metal-dependent hydrolase
MQNRRLLPRRLVLLAVCALWLAGHAVAFADDVPANELRVMSFNIRYGTANDGVNHWSRRREFVASTIREFNPDLLGTQETLGFQKDFLAENLPEYEAFGVGRDDGGDEGEMTALFYRRERFERLEGGHFWLSETPDVPGSKSWDSSLPRICSWVKLRDREDAGQRVLWFFNTHFDHRGTQARLESARLLHSTVQERCGGDRVVVTGDFNSPEGGEPFTALFAGFEEREPLIDTYRAVHPDAGSEEGTFNGFDASATSGDRIDWIAQRGWTVESAAISHPLTEGRPPSDHWPITAVLDNHQ